MLRIQFGIIDTRVREDGQVVEFTKAMQLSEEEFTRSDGRVLDAMVGLTVKDTLATWKASRMEHGLVTAPGPLPPTYDAPTEATA